MSEDPKERSKDPGEGSPLGKPQLKEQLGKPQLKEQLGKPQLNNPLHGVTLKAMLEYLIRRLGWENMANAVGIRCFKVDPSLTSSLKFLRKVPWARAKVEDLFLEAREYFGE